MPLKGRSRRTVSKNISEFHKGKTYQHTLKKFGKKKADRRAVAAALNSARRSGGRSMSPELAPQSVPSTVIKDGRTTYTKRDGKWYIRPNPLSSEVEITDETVTRGLESRVPTLTLTPHDLEPARIVNGQPVTAASALVHRDIVDDAVKSNSPQAPDIVLAAGDDKNHVFVDPNNNVLTRDQASTALGLKTAAPLRARASRRANCGTLPFTCSVTFCSTSSRLPASVAATTVPGRIAAIICCTRCLRVASAWNRTRHSPASTPEMSVRQSSCALPSAASVASTLNSLTLSDAGGSGRCTSLAAPSLTCSASAPR